MKKLRVEEGETLLGGERRGVRQGVVWGDRGPVMGGGRGDGRLPGVVLEEMHAALLGEGGGGEQEQRQRRPFHFLHIGGRQ